MICSNSISQNKISIDSISGFSLFDTITQGSLWQTYKEFYPDGSEREDVRFRIWGEGCKCNPENFLPDKKCFFRFQRQSYFLNNTISEKEVAYGWVTENDSKLFYQLLFYNEKGKLIYKEKKKGK